MPKLKALEGLRGLAACMVLYCHFLYLMLDRFEVRINELLGTKLAPWALFFSDGELAVYIFWTMSAFVISRNLWDKDPSYILKISFLKRYLRLALPVLASVVVVLILHSFHLFYHFEVASLQGPTFNHGWLWGMYRFDISWVEGIYEGLWGALWHYDKDHIYNSVLWSMEKEWWGSMVCFIYILFRNQNKKFQILYPAMGFIALKFDQSWMLCFIGGLILSETMFKKDAGWLSMIDKIQKYMFSGALGGILLFISIYLGGLKNFYGLLNPIVAQALVSLALYHDALKGLLSKRLPVTLGELSFSFYLMHMPILCSLTCVLILLGWSTIWVVWVSLIILFAAAYLFQKYIDAPAVRLSGKINTFASNEN